MLSLADENDVKEIASELDSMFRCHRDLLNREPRIANPLKEAYEAANVKYRDSVEARLQRGE